MCVSGSGWARDARAGCWATMHLLSGRLTPVTLSVTNPTVAGGCSRLRENRKPSVLADFGCIRLVVFVLQGGRHLLMALVDRLKAVIDGMPDDGSVSLPVTWLRGLLDAEGDSPGTGRLLTLQEAGYIVGRSAGTVRTWANSGQLEGAFKLQGRSWRISESAIQLFVERQQSGEHEPPTVRNSGGVDIGAWRQHLPPDRGVA